jgi:hypothetical protein
MEKIKNIRREEGNSRNNYDSVNSYSWQQESWVYVSRPQLLVLQYNNRSFWYCTYRRDDECRYDGLQQQEADCVEETCSRRRPPLNARLIQHDALKRDRLHHLKQVHVRALGGPKQFPKPQHFTRLSFDLIFVIVSYMPSLFMKYY